MTKMGGASTLRLNSESFSGRSSSLVLSSDQNLILRKKASVCDRSCASTSPCRSFLYCLAMMVSPRGEMTKKLEIIVGELYLERFVHSLAPTLLPKIEVDQRPMTV